VFASVVFASVAFAAIESAVIVLAFVRSVMTVRRVQPSLDLPAAPSGCSFGASAARELG